MPVDIDNDIIDLKTLCRVIKERKKAFITLQIVVIALVSIILVATPKVYQAHVEIAPEISSDQNDNMANMLRLLTQNSVVKKDIDAIFPVMYPNIVSSDGFGVGLFDIKVHTLDGSVNTTYYDYLKNHTRIPFWRWPLKWINQLIKSKKTQTGRAAVNNGQTLVRLSTDEERILRKIQNNTVCVVDRKTGILNLVVSDQDPLVCTTIADTITQHLKQAIILYRTNKARTDYKFSEKVYQDSRMEYEAAKQTWLDFMRNHVAVDRSDLLARKQELEQEMNTKRAILESNEIQRFTIQSKIQENTPVFSIVKKPYIPNEATFPKVGTTIVFSLLLANIAMLGFIFRKRLVKMID